MTDSAPKHKLRQSLEALWQKFFPKRSAADEALMEAVEELMEGPRAEDGFDLAERALLHNILRLRQCSVADVMIPRAHIIGIDADTSMEQVVELLRREQHSRLPVYRESLDEIIGMVHFKDVMAKLSHNEPFTLEQVLRQVIFVPSSMSVLKLLLQMRQSRQHMALVVDEFGGIDGLVTIEDLIEEIVGEIEDEHDDAATPQAVRRPDGSMLVDAAMPLEDFVATMGGELSQTEKDEIDTVGGLVFSLAGRVPTKGEKLAHPSGLEFEVLEADALRVQRLRVRSKRKSGAVA